MELRYEPVSVLGYTQQILNMVKNQKTWRKNPLKRRLSLISWLILKQKFLFRLEISKGSLAILKIFIFILFELYIDIVLWCFHLLNFRCSINRQILSNMVHTQAQIELFPKYECYRVQVFLKEKYTIKKTDWSTKIELILLLCYDNRIGTRRR